MRKEYRFDYRKDTPHPSDLGSSLPNGRETELRLFANNLNKLGGLARVAAGRQHVIGFAFGGFQQRVVAYDVAHPERWNT